MIPLNQKVQPALDAAVRTMCSNDAVDGSVGAPSIIWLVVQVRPELLDYLLYVADFTHEGFPFLRLKLTDLPGSAGPQRTL
jgi:hypothetical protein